MALDALATSDDLTRFGYTPPANADNLLDRASVRLRLAAGKQTITPDTSTVTFPTGSGPDLKLWQFPATFVHSVTDQDGNEVDDWELTGNELRLPCGYAYQFSSLTVTYSHGYATLPDELVEVVCAVAMRMSGTKPDRDPAISAQTIGDVAFTFNPAFLGLGSGLLPGEEATVRRIFYMRG